MFKIEGVRYRFLRLIIIIVNRKIKSVKTQKILEEKVLKMSSILSGSFLILLTFNAVIIDTAGNDNFW